MKEKIKNLCLKYFNEKDIIAIHFCGSYLYETNDAQSDIDIMIITRKKLKLDNVLRSDSSYQYITLDAIDAFVVDIQSAIKIHNFDESTNLYMRVFSDCIIKAKENLIHLNPCYENEFNQYTNSHINDNIIQYYGNVIDYFRNLFYVRFPNTIKKREYHIFRFLDCFLNYIKTNNFDPTYRGKHYNELLQFKKATINKDITYRNTFERALHELDKLAFDYTLYISNTKKQIENIRTNLIKNIDGVNYYKISNIKISKQNEDLSTPTNCEGYGTIHHFRRLASDNWISDYLPAYPAYKSLNLPFKDEIEAQVFQVSLCNLNCWYCFVPEELRCGNIQNSNCLSSNQLIDYYKNELNKAKVIDLSGGNPELIPEWTIDMMKELESNGLSDSVFLWCDDSMSTNAFFDYLSNEDISLLKSYKHFGKVCCFKGFDYDSYAYNSGMPKHKFFLQKHLFRKYYDLHIDLYGYITLTTDNVDNIEIKISIFFDYLQSIHKNIPLRITPLRILIFKAMEHRVTKERLDSLKNQDIVLEAWRNELNKRFSQEEINMKICDVNIYED